MSEQKPVPEQDPVVNSSLSKPLYIAAALLVLCTMWSLYDEVYGMRPWKGYQARFVRLYNAYLNKLEPVESADEQKIKNQGEYKQMAQQLQALEAKLSPQMTVMQQQINTVLTPKIIDLNSAYQEKRAKVGYLTYEIEVSSSESHKDSLRKQIAEVKQEKVNVKLTEPDGSLKSYEYDFPKMEADLAAWRAQKAEQVAKLAELRKPISELQAQMDKYVADRGPEFSSNTVRSIKTSLASFEPGIRQIHVKDINLVDRCESCHLGTREPVTLTAADMGGEKMFASHPRKDLLKIHDPETFGCTPCHNGNGVATSSIEKGHGRNKFWLWPMFYPENTEAGCQQCHVREVVTEYASTLNRGREIFRRRGCIACHRYQGFDPDWDELSDAGQQIHNLEATKASYAREIGLSVRKGDAAKTNAEAQQLYQHADDLRVRTSGLDAKIEQYDMRTSELWKEVKKVGPNLKDVKVKLVKEWVPTWIKDPHAWRPDTKMPTFRLTDEEVQAISAFIWQSGIDATLPKQPMGNAERGKESLETRGCLGCHSIGEGSQKMGGDFAANLSRIGEKENYDYVVRWIANPRQRTLPYDPYEKRDLTEADYTAHGKPFVFDLQHTKSPINGREILVENMTPMPDLRLSDEEVRDIATYLMTQKRDGAKLPAAPFMDDPNLKARGQFLVRNYGCASCHEIAGLEEEQRIGTELTKEGSKPLERLDFALLGHEAEREGWYNHKGFFEHKLENPAVYDQGKEKTNQLERLKMPNFNFEKSDIDAVTTFLLGSVESALPDRYHYNPVGQERDIIDGWWVVRKYNCMGCHQLMLDQTTSFMQMKRYQDPDWKEQRPPSLIGEGARVNPDWLEGFLRNPPQSDTIQDRNGVRTYLKARMPTFYFSNGEIRKLVRFFAALSSQATPYLPTKVEPLTENEKGMARALFTSEAAPCLKCHATGDPTHDRGATAPNFLAARERLKPGWVRRWILNPALLIPGTAMPSGLFRQDGEREVFAGPVPASFTNYSGDHADLLVRYMFNFTPDELSRLR